MEQIAKITGVVCISAFSMGVLYNIGHFPSVERGIKFVIAIYIILTCMKSAGNIDMKSEFLPVKPYLATEEYAAELNNTVVEETQRKSEEIIKQRLSEKNISYNRVSVHILEQNGLLTAEKIIVSCDDKDVAAAEECIEDFITTGTEIIIGE
ncbi:MAG: hypothetical protein E7488_00405 [Ruminococcaceae bacterium]|nr:hypothetical protein [Oscillospiraceae bacterium]